MWGSKFAIPPLLWPVAYITACTAVLAVIQIRTYTVYSIGTIYIPTKYKLQTRHTEILIFKCILNTILAYVIMDIQLGYSTNVHVTQHRLFTFHVRRTTSPRRT